MARVLILGLYYPPANFSASRRLAGWARYLPAFGHEPLVLTRYYDPAERNTGDFYASSRPTRTLDQRWIESDNVVYTQFKQGLWSKLPLPGKLVGLAHFAWPDPDHSGWLRECEAYLKQSGFKPDIIIASSSPPGVFHVAKKLSARLGVPWIADFRDLWLHDLDDSAASKLKLALQRRHLSSASGITVVTDGSIESMRQQLAPMEKPIRAIYNGADPVDTVSPHENDREALDAFAQIKSDYSTILSYPGTLYSEQHFEKHLDAIDEFNKSAGGSVAVVLLGKHDPADYKKWPFVKVLGLVAHQTSLYLQRQSTALFYPTWPANYSVFSGKIFELMVSGRPVLVGFTPSPDLVALCEQCPTVSLMKSPEELIGVLQSLPSVNDNPVVDVPPIATKKYWAAQLSSFIDELLEAAGKDQKRAHAM